MHILTSYGLKKLLHKSSIPNSEGFRLVCYDVDHVRHYCEVMKDSEGNHYVEGIEFSKIIGWSNEV